MWTIKEDPAADIHYAYSADGGRTLSDARLVGESSAHSDAPSIAVDRSGSIHLVYAERAPGSGVSQVLYSRKAAGDIDFEPPRLLSRSDRAQTGAGFPDIRVDGEGALHVVWEQYLEASGRPRGLVFTHSTDGGAHFVFPAPVPGLTPRRGGVNGSQQGMLSRKLDAAGSKRIAVVNSTFVPDERSAVLLVRGRLTD